MEPKSVERSLDASIKDGTAYAVMVGLGETYVARCAVFLGGSRSAVALLSTIPLFLGACAQLLAPPIIDRTRLRKRWFVAGSAVQALAWIPMIAAIFLPAPAGFWTLFAGFSLYLASVHFTVPPWTSVMGELVPGEIRGRWFGRRSALALFMQLFATLVGGAGLWIFKERQHEALGFIVVFAGAFLARVISVGYLTRMAEPPYVPRPEDAFTLKQFLARLPRSNFARFVLFVACMNASAHFAGSLFVPYWTMGLGYGYWEFTAVMMVIVIAQIPSLPFWGRVADRHGNRKVLVWTSVGIAVLPALWLASTHLAWACALQVWSGFCWSGFNQSVSNFLLDAVSPPKRARCTAYLNLLVHGGLLVGGVAGALAINHVPETVGPLRLTHPFWGILAVSFILRSATVAIFIPLFREVRDLPKAGVPMVLHASREVSEGAEVELADEDETSIK